MKWIGQHIYDLVARFRNDVYLEDLSTTTETNVLVVDSTGKVSKTTVITGDVTGITSGSNITVTDPTGPVPTVALSTNVDVAGTLDVTGLGTFDASVTVAGKISLKDAGDSIFVGYEAGLNDDASANLNVGVGYQALRANTTGAYNAAHGYRALYSNTTGSYNAATGASSLLSNTTGTYNTATGWGALLSNTTGANNTATGVLALYSNTTANNNTATGLEALRQNTTGANNTAYGFKALRSNTTGPNNSAVGYQALHNNTTGNSNTAIGRDALRINTTGANNSAVGYQALHSNTTGASNSAVGYQALYLNTTGLSNVATGVYALYSNTTASSNTAIGTNALFSNTTGASNTAHGLQALYFNTTGANNSAHGYRALYSNTTGTSNSAIGLQALYSNTTGANNSAVGRDALYSNTTGNNNTSVGIYSSGKNTTGTGNAALGYAALYENTTGNNNIAVGLSAGRFIADGTTANTVTSNSVFLGHNTKALADSQTNQIVIGDTAVGLGSNTAILGNSSITKTQLQGNVGIGTASPDALLEISGNAGADPGPITNPTTFRITDAGNAATGAGDVTNPWGKIEFYSEDVSSTGPSVQAQIASVYNTVYSDSSDLNFYTRASPAVPLSTRMTIEGGGNVGIGTTSPASKLHIQTDTTGTEVPLNIYGYRTAATAANARLVSVTQLNTYGIGVLDIYNSAQVSAIHLAADGDSYINPQNSGNVGIGTASPGSKLQVYTGNTANANNGITLMRGAGLDVFGIKHRSDAGGIYRGAITYDAAEVMTFLITGKVGIGTTSPQNKLDIVGSLGRGAPVTKTTDFTVAATENWLIMNGTTTITITLPTASSWTGRELMIKNIAAYTVVSASSNVKPIDTDTAATAILPATAGSWCTLVSDGTNWVTMMN
jgi:hypothetical protein